VEYKITTQNILQKVHVESFTKKIKGKAFLQKCPCRCMSALPSGLLVVFWLFLDMQEVLPKTNLRSYAPLHPQHRGVARKQSPPENNRQTFPIGPSVHLLYLRPTSYRYLPANFVPSRDFVLAFWSCSRYRHLFYKSSMSKVFFLSTKGNRKSIQFPDDLFLIRFWVFFSKSKRRSESRQKKYCFV
jgi:hypothetical protein